MNDESKFFLVYFLTIIIARIYCLLTPPGASVFEDYWHHMYYGFMIFIFLFLYRKLSRNKVIFLSAIALGLIFDELFLLFSPLSISKEDYFSIFSILGILIGSTILFWKRKEVLKEVRKLSS